jgi:hypothetical protein
MSMARPKNTKQSHTTLLERTFVVKVIFTLIGVALIQLALCSSYLAAFHAPHAKDVPISVVGSGPAVQAIATSIRQNSNGAYKTSIVPTREEAEKQIRQQHSYAAYIPGSPYTGQTATVIIASASSQSLASSIPGSLVAVSANMHISQTVSDIAPLPSGDNRGLSIFYTAFAWVFGGYLAAAALGVIRGDRAFTKRNALLRIGALAIFSAVSSLTVAAIAVHGVHAFDHGYWTLVGVGALATLATAIAASVIIALVGTLGTAVVILFFVVLGNPASGGTIAMPLVGGGPWNWFNHILPTGIGVDAIRSGLYFNSTNLARSLWSCIGYIGIGSFLLLSIGQFKGSMSYYAAEIAEEK